MLYSDATEKPNPPITKILKRIMKGSCTGCPFFKIDPGFIYYCEQNPDNRIDFGRTDMNIIPHKMFESCKLPDLKN